MTEMGSVDDQWYVAATSARPELNPQVLKSGETFALFDRYGDLQVLGPSEQGLFHEDMRHLAYQALLIEGARPLYLGSTVREKV